MNFLKKLTGGKSAKDTAMGAAKAVGLDPSIIMQKIFAKFASGKTGSGEPSMNFGKLMGFAKQFGIMDSGKGVTDGFLEGVFNKNKDKDTGDVDYKGFEKSITDIAEKKYEDEGLKGDEAKSKLEKQIISDAEANDWIS